MIVRIKTREQLLATGWKVTERGNMESPGCTFILTKNEFHYLGRTISVRAYTYDNRYTDEIRVLHGDMFVKDKKVRPIPE